MHDYQSSMRDDARLVPYVCPGCGELHLRPSDEAYADSLDALAADIHLMAERFRAGDEDLIALAYYLLEVSVAAHWVGQQILEIEGPEKMLSHEAEAMLKGLSDRGGL